MMKRRVTPEQVVGENGEKQVFTRFTDLGWNAHDISPDYGEDLLINICNEQHIPAGMSFLAQVKSSEDISEYQLKKGERDYSYPIEVKDLNHWRDYRPPVVLILWDTKKLVGYWIAVEDAAAELDMRSPDWQDKTQTKKGGEPEVCVRVPPHQYP